MTTTTRRSLLGWIAAAAPAFTVPAALASTATVPAAAVLAEKPALLALGEQIDPLLTAYRAALARHTEARTTAEANCPPVPEELVCKGMQWAGCRRCEVDVEGEEVLPPNYVGADGKTYATLRRYILNSADTKAAIARGNLYCDGRTKFGKRLRKLIRTAEQYEAERTAAIERSGVLDTAGELYHAATDIDVLARNIRDHAPVTMAGVFICARALVANVEAEPHASGWRGRAGYVLGAGLADAVLRVAGGSRGVS